MQEIVSDEYGGSENPRENHFFVRIVYRCLCGETHRQLVAGDEGAMPESVIVMPSCGGAQLRVSAPDASAWTKMLNQARGK
jgi:hypothetical protein